MSYLERNGLNILLFVIDHVISGKTDFEQMDYALFSTSLKKHVPSVDMWSNKCLLAILFFHHGEKIWA